MNIKKLAACKDALYAYLDTESLQNLRAYGRYVGVKEPCAKKKIVLLQDIVKVLTGELSPVAVSRLGAPVKNNYVKPEIIERVKEIMDGYTSEKREETKKDPVFPAFFPADGKGHVLRFESDTPSTSTNEGGWASEFVAHVYSGQYEVINDVHLLLPLTCLDGQKIILPQSLVTENGLRLGDVVTCWAKQGENALVATRILSINDMVAGTFTRIRFEEANACYPKEKIAFLSDGERVGVTEKYFDWIFPIGKGQRACVIAPPKSGKTTLLQTLAKSAKSANRNLIVLGLLVDNSPETVSAFRAVLSADNLVYTTYEEDAERQVFAAEFMLKRAKRYVEHGRDVLLIVDSLSALARAFNDTDLSSGGKRLPSGLESKTVQYIKRFLGAARCLEEGGSLTILGALSCDTGNPADELICSELSAVANWEIYLDSELAKRRIYPAVVPAKQRSVGDAEFAKGDVVSSIDNADAETLLSCLQTAQTQQELINQLKKH